MDVIERGEAKTQALRRYFTGRPCQKGHISERYTSSGTCIECLTQITKRQVESGYFRTHYKKNKPRILEKQKETYHTRRDAVIARVAEWVKQNPEKRRVISLSYKARRRALEDGGISTGDLAKWIKAQKKVCYWCSKRCGRRFHVDHYIPLSKGGKHEECNLVISCPTCNLTKNARDPYDFALERGRLF